MSYIFETFAENWWDRDWSINAQFSFATLFWYRCHTSFFKVIREYTCVERSIYDTIVKYGLIMSQTDYRILTGMVLILLYLFLREQIIFSVKL